jgi:hypothetical protein
MLYVACVLRSGGDYRPEHVFALAAGVRRHLSLPYRFVVLSDLGDAVSRPGIEVVPIPEMWPGWWSKISLFRPGLFDGPVFYADLDTIIVGELDSLVLGHRFTVLRNFWKDKNIGSGLMAWDTDLSAIYRKFALAPKKYINEYRTAEKWGDQAFILNNTPTPMDRWQLKHPGRICSYKRDIVRRRGVVPESTSVICFHGQPRPWATPLWRAADAVDTHGSDAGG